MKRMNYYLLLIVTAISLLLISCEETVTPSTNSGNEKYLPVSVNNYWVYKNIALDTDGNELTDGITHDSVVINANTVISGKTYGIYDNIYDIYDEGATKLIDSKEIKMAYDDNKIIAESGIILPTTGTLNTLFNTFFGGIATIPEYITIGDFNAMIKWDILPQIKIDSIGEVPYGDFAFDLNNTRYSIFGNKGAEDTLSIAGSDLNTQEFIITHQILTDGSITMSGMKIPLVDLAINIKIHYYFAENYGLVQKTIDPVNVKLMMLNYPLSDGSKSVMIRSSIK